MSSENFNTSSAFSDDQIKDFFEKKFKEIQTQEPVGVKLVDKDEDGQSKYVFDKGVPNSIYNDRQLIDTARAFYYTRDGIDFKTDDAVVDKFISDRTWKQANTLF